MNKQIKTFQGNKNFAISNVKVSKKDNIVRIAGYANTKNIADRYGDIPTVYQELRSYVYDITEYLKNPILLIDHNNRMDHVAGRVIKIFEDNLGLYFEAEFTQSEHPLVAHARSVYAEGIANSISIGGHWYFEDTENPNHLTLAKIHEISLVAIPADPNATVEVIEAEKAADVDGIQIDKFNAKIEIMLNEQKIDEINQKFVVKLSPVKQGSER